MRKLKLFFAALALLVGGSNSVWAADKVVGERFTSLQNLNGKLFAVVDETSSKAMGIGVAGHNNGWDMYFGTYNEAFASNACYYKIEQAQGEGVSNYYYLRTYNSNGNMYTAWKDASQFGYFNSQTGTGGYFALGLEGRNGQDALNHAVWEITVSEGKFAIKNIGTGKYLHADQLSNTYSDPFYFTFCTLIDDPKPAAIEKYNTLKAKYLEINSGLVHDVSSLENLDLEGVQDAIAELVSIFENSLSDNTNLTALITNPSFESNGLSGWTNNGMQAQGNKTFGGTVGDTYCEAWQPNGTKGISQTLTMPKGVYRLTANCLARGVTSAKLYIGNQETAITVADASKNYRVDILSTQNGDIVIGFEGVGTGAETSWLCVDNFQLSYIGDMTSEEFEAYEALTEASEAYDVALADAQSIAQNSIPETAYSNLQTTINNNTVTNGTTEQYNNAASALSTATTAALALVDPYAEYLEKKDNATAMKDADTYIGADAKTTLEGVINTTATNVEAATTVAAIETEITNLVAAAKTFVTSVTIKANQCLDLTCLLTNPHFKRGGGTDATGWTLESGSVGERRASTHNFEAWHRTFNLSQTIANLPVGTYKVTLQGFARHDGSDINKTNLYCGIVNQIIKDINDEYSTTSLISGKPNMGDGNGESNTDGKYRPNGMSASYYFFQEVNTAVTPNQPFYTNEVQTVIDEPGNLKIGFKCETNTDWVIWDNFHLYYYGSAIAVTIDENAANSSYSADIENANVTLKRTFSAGKWNTIALPFDIDNETLAAKFGTVEVAEYTETADPNDDNNSIVKFEAMTTPSITANKPVLMKTSTTENTFTFNGVTIKAGEAKVEGAKSFDFVGTYAASTTIAEGDYFISSDKLYKSKGNTSIKGTRAYLKLKDNAPSSARITNIFFGDDATVIGGVKVAGDSGKIYNLNGQEVKSTRKGIFIQGGKKIVVK